MFTEMFAFRGGRFIVRSVLLLRVMSFVLVELLVGASSWCSPARARDSPGSNSTGGTFARV